MSIKADNKDSEQRARRKSNWVIMTTASVGNNSSSAAASGALSPSKSSKFGFSLLGRSGFNRIYESMLDDSSSSSYSNIHNNSKKYNSNKKGLQRLSENGGDIFFKNTVTGETTWDQPDDYITEDELELTLAFERMKFDPKLDDLNNITIKLQQQKQEHHDSVSASMDALEMHLLDLFGDENAKNEVVNYLQGKDKEIVEEKLEQVYLVARYGNPSASNWESFLAKSNNQLIRNIILLLSNPYECTPRTRQFAIELILFFVMILSESLSTSVLKLLIKSSTEESTSIASSSGKKNHIIETTMKNIDLGMREASLKKDADDRQKALLAWTNFSIILLSSIINDDEDTIVSSLPDQAFIEFLYGLLLSQGETIYIQVAQMMILLNVLFSKENGSRRHNDHPNLLLKAAGFIVSKLDAEVSSDPTESFCEAIQYLLNACQYPYTSEQKHQLLAHVLRIMRSIFSDPDAGDSFFVSSDIKIIIDICLQQVENLPPNDILRVQFILLICDVVKYPIWKKDLQLYRMDDIFSTMESCIKAKDQVGMLQQVVDAAISTMETAASVAANR